MRSSAVSKSSGSQHDPPLPHRGDRRLVGEVRQIRTREARRRSGHRAQVDVGTQLLAGAVHHQDRQALSLGRQGNDDLAIEAARAEERGIERVGAVCCGQHHDAMGGIEAVHLSQQLVEGLLPLVVAVRGVGAADLADRVDLVDEHDGRRALACLLEEVAHPAGAHAHVELHEARPAGGEERHAGLTGDGPGEEGLAGSRRTDHQHPTRPLGSGLLVALGPAQVVDDLADLLLHALVAGDVIEGRRRRLGGIDDVGGGAPEPAGTDRSGAPTEPQQDDEQDDRHEPRQEGGSDTPTARLRRFGFDRHAVGQQPPHEPLVGGVDRGPAGERATVTQRPLQAAPVMEAHLGHLAPLHPRGHLRVRKLHRLAARRLAGRGRRRVRAAADDGEEHHVADRHQRQEDQAERVGPGTTLLVRGSLAHWRPCRRGLARGPLDRRPSTGGPVRPRSAGIIRGSRGAATHRALKRGRAPRGRARSPRRSRHRSRRLRSWMVVRVTSSAREVGRCCRRCTLAPVIGGVGAPAPW